MQQIKQKDDIKDLEKLKGLGTPFFQDHKTYVSFAKLIESYGGETDIGFGELALVALLSPGIG
jgi:hypothetical protein